MLPGDHWQFVLGDAIGVARCVMVTWSHTSISSKWVRMEAEEGRRRHILVPVLIDDVVPPFPFGGIQAARLVGWAGLAGDMEFQQLGKAVRNVAPRSTPSGQDLRAAAPVILTDGEEHIADTRASTAEQLSKAGRSAVRRKFLGRGPDQRRRSNIRLCGVTLAP